MRVCNCGIVYTFIVLYIYIYCNGEREMEYQRTLSSGGKRAYSRVKTRRRQRLQLVKVNA